jgi:hypothetical protein
MNALSKLAVKLETYPFKTWYVFSEMCLSYFYNKPKLRILFSKKPTWKIQLKRIFRFLPHTLSFTRFDSKIIAEYDLVVPLYIEDVLYLNTVRHLLKNENLIPIPSTECANLCDDKYLFAMKLIELGFGDYVPKIGNNLSYPHILKKKIDAGSVNTYIVENQEQELTLLSSVDGDEYFDEEFIRGTHEYATNIFFKNQRIIRSVTLEDFFERDDSIKNKDNNTGVKMHKDCPYLDLFAEILIGIGFEGICCFNYKIIDNRPIIFEVNPHCDGDFAVYFFSFLRSLDYGNNWKSSVLEDDYQSTT